MLTRGATYEEMREAFVWNIPERYNIGVDVCDRWAEAEPHRLAMIHVGDAGEIRRNSP